jgi:ABC-type uncharacterized transport system auxiliary subunit
MMKTFSLNFPKSGHGLVLVLLLGAFTLTGCLSRPALKTQTFSFGSPASNGTNLVVGQPVLGIKKLEVGAPHEGRELVYRTGDFTYVRDPYATFLGAPEQELLAPVRAGLSSGGDFSAVTGTGGVLKLDIMVEIQVSQLFGDFREKDKAKAVLTMRFSFCTATNGMASQLLFQKEYSRSIPLDAPSAAALMKGWNEGLTEILSDVLSDYRRSRSGGSVH